MLIRLFFSSISVKSKFLSAEHVEEEIACGTVGQHALGIANNLKRGVAHGAVGIYTTQHFALAVAHLDVAVL